MAKSGRPSLNKKRVEIQIPDPLFKRLTEEAELRGVNTQRLVVDILVARDLGGLTVAPAYHTVSVPAMQDLADQVISSDVPDQWM